MVSSPGYGAAPHEGEANAADTGARVLPRGTRFTSDVPPRLDRLPWSRWHWRIVIALGVTWMLDGLEVTVVGAVGNVLQDRGALGLSAAQVGFTASAYLAGAVLGALVFGRLTDALGRRRLFFVTLALYLLATVGTALSWSFASFAFFRMATGAAIGGEYAAINSAIDELLPARVRGRADLAINGTYWVGTALGAIVSMVLLRPTVLPEPIGWRVCFGLGALLGVIVLALRSHVPESPRWLLLHGRVAEAREVVAGIEREVGASTHRALPEPGRPVELEVKGSVSFGVIARVLFRRHRRRAVLALALMASQAFAYNGIFFTYALVLGRYDHVASNEVGQYILPFAVVNFLGPVLLGHLYDSLGRKAMVAITYATSGVLLLGAGWAAAHGGLSPATQTALWCAVFFVASAAASSAYLTASEVFPVELRGMAIAIFYAVGTAMGGVVAPALFGALLQTGRREELMVGYGAGSALLIVAAVLALWLGVPAERRTLEQIAALDDGHRAPSGA